MKVLHLSIILTFSVFLTSNVFALDISRYEASVNLPTIAEKTEGAVKKEDSGAVSVEPDVDLNPEMVFEAPEPISKPSRQDAIIEEKPALIQYESNPLAVKAVDRSLTHFTADKMKDIFSLWLSRSGKYLELMRMILKSKDIPEDIVFLSLIESGFNPNAYSVARAVGPWQFISSTAKKYGLEIDWWRDERRDPIKSTEAAAAYLKDLYEMFGSWNLAMAAYNAGEGKILRALHRTKSDDYWSLLKTRHIKRETKNYVPKFIAASMIAVNPAEFGFYDIEYHEPFDYDEVTVSSPLDLEIAAECADTTIDVIKELNPELRRWCTPPDMEYYVLRIPAGAKELFLKNLAEVPEEEKFTVDTYIVKKGDTINSISKKKGMTAKAILALNKTVAMKMPLMPGTTLSLPPKEKFYLDRDDRFELRKSSWRKYRKSRSAKSAKSNSKKTLVTSVSGKKKTLID